MATNLEKIDFDDNILDISNKVDKIIGKSLISDSEIARLANVHNYDDTQIKKDVLELKSIAPIYTGDAIPYIVSLFISEDVKSQNNKKAADAKIVWHVSTLHEGDYLRNCITNFDYCDSS